MDIMTDSHAGIFVPVRIGNTMVEALLDTGSCVNVLSTILVNMVLLQLVVEMEPCEWNMVCISGTPFRYAGMLDGIMVELGQNVGNLRADFVVANIQEQLIIRQPC